MYIGKTPTVGNFQKCDALTASGTADYTLQVGSANVSPESVNHMIVSLNGVIQAPTTAYTISGATLSFASALTSADSIDFILLLGNVLDIGTPSDNTVSLAKMAGGTDGNIISYDASGNPVAIATGTSGHFLKSQGAGAQPVFAAAGGKTIKRHHFTMATRTAGVGTLADQFTVTSSFVPILPTAGNNDLYVEWVSPKNGSDHAYTNIGLRFNDGSTDYDYPVGNMSSRANDIGFAGGVFNIAAGTIPAGTYSIIVRAFITSSAPDYWNPNSSDNAKLSTQTYTSVMITEYKN